MSEYLCIKHACLEPAMENDILCRKHAIESPIAPVICDHSELLQTIADLQLENKQLRKQDKHREKIWKARVAELETESQRWQVSYRLQKKENYDLMTISIPELQLDLKDALAKVAELEGFCERFVNSYPDWSDSYEALKQKEGE